MVTRFSRGTNIGGGIRRFNSYKIQDSDAIAYLAKLEAVEGSLENSVAKAFEELILGHKEDGDWDKINLILPMIATKTVLGSLVTIKGNNVIPYNVTSSNYNRRKGILGNGTNLYIDLNYPSNTDPQDNFFRSAYVSENLAQNITAGIVLASGFSTNGTQIYVYNTLNRSRAKGSAASSYSNEASKAGFYGINRNNATNYQSCFPNTEPVTTASTSTANNLYKSFVFGQIAGDTEVNPTLFGSNRVCMVYAGVSISSLTTIRARVKTFLGKITRALSAPSFSPASTTTLFVLAGQSNAAGHGSLSKTNFPYTYSRVQTYKKSNHLSTLDDGSFQLLNFASNNVTTGTAAVNDVGCFTAKLLEENTANDIRIVKVAVGSTGFVNGTGAWGKGKSLREALLKHYLVPALNDLISESRIIRVLPIMWICGETDSQQETSANAYSRELTSFYEDIRFIIPRVPIVSVQVRDGINTTNQFPFFQKVRAAEEEVTQADSNNYLINADDLPLADVVHYTNYGYQQIAARYLNLCEQIGSIKYN